MSVSQNKKRAWLWGTCAAFAMPTGFAVAQDLEDDYFTLDTITVEMQDDQQGAADRATAVYVADAELERARMGDVKDLFAGIASVSVGGAIPVAQKIFVNGVDMLNLTMAIDGVLQNNRAFHHVSANVFDPGMLKFVRVDPGIAAADTGPNAVAGAVIMETVDAADVLDEGDNFGGNLRLSYGDNGDTFSQALTLAGKSGNWEALGYLKSANGNDYKNGNGDVVAGTAADLKSGLLKFAYDDGQQHRVEVSAQRIIDDALRPFRANIGALRGVASTRVYETERNTYSIRYEDTRNEGMWDPEVVLGYSQSIVNVPVPFGSKGDSSTLSGKLQNTFHLSNSNTVVAGVDFYDREATYSDPRRSELKEAATNIGVFAQARFEFGDAWELSSGLRYDWQSFDGIETGTNNGANQDVSGASGNLSVRYNINEFASIRAGYSNVFGGIQLEDNYIFDRAGGWNYGNLKPSRAQNYTIGFDLGNANTKFGGELFLTEIDDVREGGSNFDFESRGFNLGVTHLWDTGSLRFTLSDSKVSRDGDGVGSFFVQDFGAPIGTVAALEVQQRIPEYNLLVGGALDMALGEDKLLQGSNVTQPGYVVASVFAEYTPENYQNLTFRATINNLFDKQFSDRATYGQDYAVITPLSEPGRTIVLEAIAKF